MNPPSDDKHEHNSVVSAGADDSISVGTMRTNNNNPAGKPPRLKEDHYFNPCCCSIPIYQGTQVTVIVILILSVMSGVWDVYYMVGEIKQLKNSTSTSEANNTIIFWVLYMAYDVVSLALDIHLYCSLNKGVHRIRIWIYLMVSIPLEFIYFALDCYKHITEPKLDISQLLHLCFWIVADIYMYLVVFAYVRYLTLRSKKRSQKSFVGSNKSGFNTPEPYGDSVRGSYESYYGAFPGHVSKYTYSDRELEDYEHRPSDEEPTY